MRRCSVWLGVLAWALLSCAGRPTFRDPGCETAYDDCVSGCGGKCPEASDPAAQPLYKELQVECAECINRCKKAGEKCDR